MSWLPWPVLPKKRWPQVRFKEKRAITALEHQAIVAAEQNPERRAFYELCWHLGGAQSDVANLNAEDIDWQAKVVSFSRSKTGTASIIRFGDEDTELIKARRHPPRCAHHRLAQAPTLDMSVLRQDTASTLARPARAQCQARPLEILHDTVSSSVSHTDPRPFGTIPPHFGTIRPRQEFGGLAFWQVILGRKCGGKQQ